MTVKTRACLRCRGQTRPAEIAQATGEERPLALALHALPVLECEKGHKQFIDTEFPLRVLDRLGEEASKLPAARERGMLLFKRFYCGGCGAELKDAAQERKTVGVDIALEGLPQFRAELSLPFYRCAGCSAEQVRSTDEATGRLPAALAHAFQGAGIPHG